jgi:hypothetical protein
VSRRLVTGRGAAALAMALLGAAGCASLRGLVEPSPAAIPAGRDGWVAYEVGALRVEAPAAWSAAGGGRRVTLEAGDEARLEAAEVEERFADRAACLAAAEESLQRGEARLSRVRRHPTTLAGQPALVQEADSGGWHGWAYAACRGPVQYRLSFSGRSPIRPELLEAWRDVVRAVRM